MNNIFFELDNNFHQTEGLEILPQDMQGKIYLDLPHRYFADLSELKQYIIDTAKMRVNVVLMLPHFKHSYSEYVVTDYEKPSELFKSWESFAETMKFIRDNGMDPMIDIPLNHCDKEVKNLDKSWFLTEEGKVKEAGAMDYDEAGNEIFIGWGAFLLDNNSKELLDYWIEKVIEPHVNDYFVSAVRLDAAWSLPDKGLHYLIERAKSLSNTPWFLAENLGLDRLINLAKSSLSAGADRFFNNFYWADGAHYFPLDLYRMHKRSGSKPTCNIWSNHDVIPPAMKAFMIMKAHEFENKNSHHIAEVMTHEWNINSLHDLNEWEQKNVIKLMKMDYALSALLSSDVMINAGSERCLFKRTDVLVDDDSIFKNSSFNSDMPDFISAINRIKHSIPLFSEEGTILPFGKWQLGKRGIKGYIKKKGEHYAIVAVNTDVYGDSQDNELEIPRQIKNQPEMNFISNSGILTYKSTALGDKINISPGKILIGINKL